MPSCFQSAGVLGLVMSTKGAWGLARLKSDTLSVLLCLQRTPCTRRPSCLAHALDLSSGRRDLGVSALLFDLQPKASAGRALLVFLPLSCLCPPALKSPGPCGLRAPKLRTLKAEDTRIRGQVSWYLLKDGTFCIHFWICVPGPGWGPGWGLANAVIFDGSFAAASVNPRRGIQQEQARPSEHNT